MWISQVAGEVEAALERGVPVEGICIDPVLDRPDWQDMTRWHRSGPWDLLPDAGGVLRRVDHPPYQDALHSAQRGLSDRWVGAAPVPSGVLHVG
jgi:hypothetical protein